MLESEKSQFCCGISPVGMTPGHQKGKKDGNPSKLGQWREWHCPCPSQSTASAPLSMCQHGFGSIILPSKDFPSSRIQGLGLTLVQSSCPLWVRGIRCELTQRAPLRCSDQQSKLNITQIKTRCCQPLGWAKLPVLRQNEPLLHTPVTTAKAAASAPCTASREQGTFPRLTSLLLLLLSFPFAHSPLGTLCCLVF